MRKFLVPTDFSDTSKNAARYAVQLAAGIGDSSIVLYHAYNQVSSGSDGSLILDGDSESLQKVSLAALENLKTSLQLLANVPVACVAEEGSLVENLERLFHHHELDLIIMGITGASTLDQIFIGSHTLRVVDANLCPVLIIPPDARYSAVETVVFCSDFQDVEASTPIKTLRTLLDLLKPSLHVVNVHADHFVALSPEYQQEKDKMDELLRGYNPEYAFIRLYDFVESINLYATDAGADMIITVPRKHHFLTSLFKTSHTAKLAYHSHIPILAVHA